MVRLAGFQFTPGMISMQFKLVLSGQPVATEVCARRGRGLFFVLFLKTETQFL